MGIVCPPGAQAQGRTARLDTIPADSAYVEPGPPSRFMHTVLFTLSSVETKRDNEIFLGGAYRFGYRPWDLGILASFSGRTEVTYTLEPIRPNLYLQREERYRLLFSLSLDKVLMLYKWFGLYGGVGIGYSWGDYEGTEINPRSTGTAVLDVGINCRFPLKASFFPVRIGYRYVDRVTSDNQHVYFAFGVGF